MHQTVTSTRAENGSVILLNRQGFPVNQFGSTYVASGICEKDLIVVSSSGNVDHYTIEHGRPSFQCNLGRTHGAAAIQVNGSLNFSIMCTNGQQEIYVSGKKTDTINVPDARNTSATAVLTSYEFFNSESTITHTTNATNLKVPTNIKPNENLHNKALNTVRWISSKFFSKINKSNSR